MEEALRTLKVFRRLRRAVVIHRRSKTTENEYTEKSDILLWDALDDCDQEILNEDETIDPPEVYYP